MKEERALNAGALTDSIGVNTHLADSASPYGNKNTVLDELNYLGTKNVRDNGPSASSTPYYEALASAGVKFDLVITPNPNVELGAGEIPTELGYISQIVDANPKSIIGLEGQNEPNNFPDLWNSQPTNNWTTVLQVQQAQYAAVKADPTLAAIPVLNASVGSTTFAGSPPNFSPAADLGNTHVYPYSGDQPFQILHQLLADQQQVVPGKPDWITEFGYSTTPGDPTYGVNALTQEKNILNGLLDAFQAGVPRTYIYQLSEEVPNIAPNQPFGALGLFNFDGTPKPAATGIHNLTTILSDTAKTAANFSPGTLSYSVSDLPSSARSMLVEKSNGEFDVLLWNETTDWNPGTQSPAVVPASAVKVSFGEAGQVNVYDPLQGSAPINSLSGGSSTTVTLTDHPLVVSLKPDRVFSAICFLSGTLIRTPAGEMAVERLRRGDLVITMDGRSMPVAWIGRQTVSRVFADPLRVLPIRIKANALGDCVPSRDLLLSPDHAIFIADVLVQAGALANGTSVLRESNVPETFTYYHVELDDHSLIFAENTPAETFIDNVDRLGFDNWGEHEALYPAGKPLVEMPHPRAKAYRQVPAYLRECLAERGQRLYGIRKASILR